MVHLGDTGVKQEDHGRETNLVDNDQPHDIFAELVAARESIIKQNQQRMHNLGLTTSSATGKINASGSSQSQAQPSLSKRTQSKKRARQTTQNALRKSQRLAQKHAKETKAFNHTDETTGETGEIGALDDAGMKDQRENERKSSRGIPTARSWEERIAEIGLTGLVHFDDHAEKAEFLVSGSKGQPYRVVLHRTRSDRRRACECASSFSLNPQENIICVYVQFFNSWGLVLNAQVP